MRRNLWRVTPILVVGFVLSAIFAGCSSNKTAQNPSNPTVAGKQEQYPAAQPAAGNKVTATITDSGITVSPNNIPSGNVTVDVVNKSSRPQSLTFSGKGMKKSTQTLQPGQSGVLNISNATAGSYTVTGSKDKSGNAHSTQVNVLVPKTAVTATITDTGITISPNNIPAGVVNLNIVNKTNTPQMVTLSGKGMKSETKTIEPGQSGGVTVTAGQGGTYTLTSSKGKGSKALNAKLNVKAPAYAK